jgi:hypothetical protein
MIPLVLSIPRPPKNRNAMFYVYTHITRHWILTVTDVYTMYDRWYPAISIAISIKVVSNNSQMYYTICYKISVLWDYKIRCLQNNILYSKISIILDISIKLFPLSYFNQCCMSHEAIPKRETLKHITNYVYSHIYFVLIL